MTVTIHFHRAEGHATFHGMRAWGVDSYLDLCRVLADRGRADDDAVMIDERGMRCITVKSFHSAARRYRPTDADLAAKAERAAAVKAEEALFAAQ